MNQKPAISIYKLNPYCGGPTIYGTKCSKDEITNEVFCTCSKATVKGYDWTIIYYLIQKVNQTKVHLVDRYTTDTKKRSQERVWEDLSNEFNREMILSGMKTLRQANS